MLELVVQNIISLHGRGLELGILPDGNLQATTGDLERTAAAPTGCNWTAFDLAGAVIGERRFSGPAWLPIFWKNHQLTAITESREEERGHWQHRSRLVLLDEGQPKTLDEFDWECYADRPNIIGDHLWIGVSRGVGRQIPSFAWRWDGENIKRFPIGRKMDWVSTPVNLSAGVIACEVESFLAKEEQAGAVCFLADGQPVARTPWIPNSGGEFAGKLFWIRDKLWIYTSRGVLRCFSFQGSKIVDAPLPAFLGPASGLSKDAPARLALYEYLGERAAAEFEPEAKIEWVLPVDRGALVGYWTFRRFVVRRVRPDGTAEAEVQLPSGGISMRRPIRHPLGGILTIQTDGTVVVIRDATGSSTQVMPALGSK
ncbi:MAG: hypothetical protein HYY18_23215 [Planctomycetes bacterium]|nr:hypothetical protein [Planctomycetota bacterium]